MTRAPCRRRNFFIILCVMSAFVFSAEAAMAGILYHNGPLINSRGTGVYGAHESIFQLSTLGMSMYGWNADKDGNYSLADDFVIADTMNGDITAITFFAYQTGSTTESTITGVYYQIWDGPPNDGGSSVVYGNMSTNSLDHTTWSGIYRVYDFNAGTSADRPVMLVRADASGCALTPGTYWIQWALTGSLVSGPWCPFITINGVATTGNALYSDDGGTTWYDSKDSGSDTVQGYPFILHTTYRYYIPYFVRGNKYGSTAYTALALRNSSASSQAVVDATMFDLEGNIDATFFQTIDASGEWAQVLNSGDEGWILITSDQPLTGLCWIGALEGGWPWLMADITLIPDLAYELIVPHVAEDNDFDTSIYVCNPHGRTNNVTLQFVEEDGTESALYSQTYALPPNGTREIDLDVILPAGVLKSRGSVRITAELGVAAYALYYDFAKVTDGNLCAGISAVNPSAVGLGYGIGELVPGLM